MVRSIDTTVDIGWQKGRGNEPMSLGKGNWLGIGGYVFSIPMASEEARENGRDLVSLILFKLSPRILKITPSFTQLS